MNCKNHRRLSNSHYPLRNPAAYSSSTSRMPRCSYTTLRCFPVRATTTPRSVKVLIARSACGLDKPRVFCKYRVLMIGCAIKFGNTRQTAASERTPYKSARASSNCSHKSSISFLPLVAANRQASANRLTIGEASPSRKRVNAAK